MLLQEGLATMALLGSRAQQTPLLPDRDSSASTTSSACVPAHSDAAERSAGEPSSSACKGAAGAACGNISCMGFVLGPVSAPMTVAAWAALRGCS